MPRGVFDVSVLGIRTSRFSTTLNSFEYLITVKTDPHGHQSLKPGALSRKIFSKKKSTKFRNDPGTKQYSGYSK